MKKFKSVFKRADRILSVLAGVWLLFHIISWEITPPPVSLQALPATLQTTWQSLKEKNLIHGSFLVIQGDKVLFADGPLDRKYPIASISKSFVGFRFFQLQKEGLSLQTPACHWLKSFCVEGVDHITLQQLLDHRSGFGRDVSFWQYLKRTFDSDWSIKNIDTMELSAQSLQFAPGSDFSYSNFGYLALSRILELIEQKEFSEIVDAMAKDASLTHTSLIKKDEIYPTSHLIPFTKISWTTNFKTTLDTVAGAGGIASTAEDLAKWLTYLEKNNFMQIFEKSKESYAHGWIKSRKSSYQAYWHNGASPGAYALAAQVPSSDLRVVQLTDQLTYAKQWSHLTEQFETFFY